MRWVRLRMKSFFFWGVLVFFGVLFFGSLGELYWEEIKMPGGDWTVR
jgi:hypothetical protein